MANGFEALLFDLLESHCIRAGIDAQAAGRANGMCIFSEDGLLTHRTAKAFFVPKQEIGDSRPGMGHAEKVNAPVSGPWLALNPQRK